MTSADHKDEDDDSGTLAGHKLIIWNSHDIGPSYDAALFNIKASYLPVIILKHNAAVKYSLEFTLACSSHCCIRRGTALALRIQVMSSASWLKSEFSAVRVDGFDTVSGSTTASSCQPLWRRPLTEVKAELHRHRHFSEICHDSQVIARQCWTLKSFLLPEELLTYEAKKKEAEENMQPPPEPVRARIPFTACLQAFTEPENVPDFWSSALQAKSAGVK